MENPALSSPNGEPVPMPGEFFVLSRHGISFSAKSGSWKGEGRGNLYLSTLRIVFVVACAGRLLPQTVEDYREPCCVYKVPFKIRVHYFLFIGGV